MELPVLTRKLTLKDDLTQVGRLIYLTDPYIFPYLFDSDIEAAARVFAEMVKGDTIYNVETKTSRRRLSATLSRAYSSPRQRPLWSVPPK